MIAMTFMVAGAWRAPPGSWWACSRTTSSPDMGGQIQLRGLAVVILGGMGNMEGAVLGGFTWG